MGKIKMGKTVIALALLVMAIVAVESKAIEKPESISGTKKSSKLPANPPDGKKENNPPGKLGWIFGEPPKGNLGWIFGEPPKGKLGWIFGEPPKGKLGWIFGERPKGNLGWIFGEPPKGNAEKTLLAYLKAHPEQVKKFMSQVKAKGPAIEAYIKAHPE